MKNSIIIFFFLFCINCLSQESSKVLLLTKNNSKINYWLKSDNKKRSGLITKINDLQIIVNDTITLNIADLEKFKLKKARYFIVGKKVDYLLHTDENRIKGKINAIKDSSLIINDKEIALNSIYQLGGKAASYKVVKIIGGTIMVAGGGLTVVGLSLISSSVNLNDSGSPLAFVIGIGSTVVGITSIIIVGVPLFINKNYDIGFEWTPVVLKQKLN